jgi:deoxyribodipyrimidine photo-lyase
MPMTLPAPTVVWFRNDLRLADNPALSAAATDGPIIPLFVYDDSPSFRSLGGAAQWWLDKALRALAGDLAAQDIPLLLRRGDPIQILPKVMEETGAKSVCWNRSYDGLSVHRDSQIKAAFTDRGLRARSFNGSLLNEPWDLLSAVGTPYRVFTPYWRAALAKLDGSEMLAPLPRPPLAASDRRPNSDRLEDWGLHPVRPDWSGGFSNWKPGEAGAMKTLSSFLSRAVESYLDHRNLPSVSGTSKLSPHLRFGEISPRQVWAAAKAATADAPARAGQVHGFLRELGWREFNYQLMFHFRDAERGGFNPRFAKFAWTRDDDGLQAWKLGRTGYPIVDAGMRELWATGWMHNRVRMIVASFLTKDLLIDWREGEAWFWDTLVDADLANNSSGWQWVAGCGADAAPYFRVFNPVLQGEKFDPHGDYVRRWVPELARLPNACIHQPWRAETTLLASAGVRLGETYPAPIIDHARARQRALAAYERLE